MKHLQVHLPRDANSRPLSESNVSGAPSRENNSRRYFATMSVCFVSNASAQTYFVKWSMTTNKSLCPEGVTLPSYSVKSMTTCMQPRRVKGKTLASWVKTKKTYLFHWARTNYWAQGNRDGRCPTKDARQTIIDDRLHNCPLSPEENSPCHFIHHPVPALVCATTAVVMAPTNDLQKTRPRHCHRCNHNFGRKIPVQACGNKTTELVNSVNCRKVSFRIKVGNGMKCVM